MTTYFVSRHPGAIEWAASQRFCLDALVTHLDAGKVQPGDTVIGSLPVNLAAQVCECGAAYWHLSLELPAKLRGRELSATDMHQLGAHLRPYRVESTTIEHTAR
jgi:CRISPR-associated protein Csx16